MTSLTNYGRILFYFESNPEAIVKQDTLCQNFDIRQSQMSVILNKLLDAEEIMVAGTSRGNSPKYYQLIHKTGGK